MRSLTIPTYTDDQHGGRHARDFDTFQFVMNILPQMDIRQFTQDDMHRETIDVHTYQKGTLPEADECCRRQPHPRSH